MTVSMILAPVVTHKPGHITSHTLKVGGLFVFSIKLRAEAQAIQEVGILAFW